MKHHPPPPPPPPQRKHHSNTKPSGSCSLLSCSSVSTKAFCIGEIPTVAWPKKNASTKKYKTWSTQTVTPTSYEEIKLYCPRPRIEIAIGRFHCERTSPTREAPPVLGKSPLPRTVWRICLDLNWTGNGTVIPLTLAVSTNGIDFEVLKAVSIMMHHRLYFLVPEKEPGYAYPQAVVVGDHLMVACTVPTKKTLWLHRSRLVV